jgi:thiosulfate/3-mercaptopyruvate sulfurtransferase
VKWVSTEWLQEHLTDPDLMILDTQPNMHDYILEHIPGALYKNEGLFRAHGKRFPNAWLSSAAIREIFCSMGIRQDSPIVIYTGPGPLSACSAFIGDGLEQTMVAYSLARFGHNKVCILDGGLDKWKAEGRPLSKEFPSVRESDFTINLRREYFVEYNEFRALKDRDDVIVLDARPPNFYEGQGPWIRPGHIPGAVSLPWKGLMDEKNKKLLRPDEEIKTMLRERGVTRDKIIICTCGTGREATNEFLLFRYYMGYPQVRIYEGSFTEWTMYPDNPTVVGKNPR